MLVLLALVLYAAQMLSKKNPWCRGICVFCSNAQGLGKLTWFIQIHPFKPRGVYFFRNYLVYVWGCCKSALFPLWAVILKYYAHFWTGAVPSVYDPCSGWIGICDRRLKKTRHLIRSAIYKHRILSGRSICVHFSSAFLSPKSQKGTLGTNSGLRGFVQYISRDQKWLLLGPFWTNHVYRSLSPLCMLHPRAHHCSTIRWLLCTTVREADETSIILPDWNFLRSTLPSVTLRSWCFFNDDQIGGQGYSCSQQLRLYQTRSYILLRSNAGNLSKQYTPPTRQEWPGHKVKYISCMPLESIISVVFGVLTYLYPMGSHLFPLKLSKLQTSENHCTHLNHWDLMQIIYSLEREFTSKITTTSWENRKTI